MDKVIKFLLIIPLCLLLGSCQSIPQKQMVLYSIDEAAVSPVEIFIHNNELHFIYTEDNGSFSLTAALPQQPETQIEFIEFSLDDNTYIPAKEKEHLTDVTDLWEAAGLAYALEITPKEAGAGIAITVFTTDGILFTDKDGKLKFENLKDMPDYVQITRTIKHEEFISALFEKLEVSLKEFYPQQTKFYFHLKDTPMVPFMYYDTEEDFAAVLTLPDFKKIKKDIFPGAYSVKMVYSFFIKSHLIPIVKAPFTTAHRLLNQLVVTTGTIFRPNIKDTKGEIPPLAEADYMDIEAFNKYLDDKVVKRVYKGNVEMLIDGEEFFSHFQATAAAAQEDINIRLYVFATDPYTLGLADMLKRKSKEGVKVKVLLDELNTVMNWSRTPQVIEGKEYKMPSIKKYLKKGSKVKVRTHPNTWLNFAHTKVIVIDNKTAYTGGMNFGETYRYFWHDMMFALQGPVVDRLNDDFKQAWLFAGAGGDFTSGFYAVTRTDDDYEGDTSSMADIRILYTTPGASEIMDAQVAAIKRAQNRIYLENPYFSDPKIINELIKARARGVDVRVILPSHNNVGIMYKNNLVKTNILLKNGIRVYMFKGMTHIKAGLFDDWASVGSANFDRYSLHINQEMNLGINDPTFIKELEEKLFTKDFENSNEVTEPFSIAWSSYLAAALNPMK
ncbi:phosphatidylserine/phosphatidylglycerophosphate/cardiolipin synthase-like enzyme [Elusimicrobium posterum]|uniref:phospholipase D-like domain-containing protein n=1 Tax=Elusimicrobium posterum TaxID=3116653 RepID=UPI003C744B68